MGRGPLIEVAGTMDHTQYMKVLREDFLPEATVLIDRGIPVKLIHDNSPCHRDVKAYIRNSGVEFIDWPADSPDLKPTCIYRTWREYS